MTLRLTTSSHVVIIPSFWRKRIFSPIAVSVVDYKIDNMHINGPHAVGVVTGDLILKKTIHQSGPSEEQKELKNKFKDKADRCEREFAAWNMWLDDVVPKLGGCTKEIWSSLKGLDAKLAELLKDDADMTTNDLPWTIETVLRWCPDTKPTLGSVMEKCGIDHPVYDSERLPESLYFINKIRFRMALVECASNVNRYVKEEMRAAVGFPWVSEYAVKELKTGSAEQYLSLLGLIRSETPRLFFDLLCAYLNTSLDCHKNTYVLGSPPTLPRLYVARPRYEEELRQWLTELAGRGPSRRRSSISSNIMVVTGLESVGKTTLAWRAAVVAMEVGFDWVVWVSLQKGDTADVLRSKMAYVLTQKSYHHIRSHIEKLVNRGDRCLAVVDDLEMVPPEELTLFTAALVTDRSCLCLKREQGASKEPSHLPVHEDLTETDVRLLWDQLLCQLREQDQENMLEEAGIVDVVLRLCSDVHFNPMAVGLVLGRVRAAFTKRKLQSPSDFRENIFDSLTTQVCVNLHSAVQASVQLLDDDVRECYLRLAILDDVELHFSTARRLWENVRAPYDVLDQLIDFHLLLPHGGDRYLLHSCFTKFLKSQTVERRTELLRVVFEAYSGDPRAVPDEDRFFHLCFVDRCLELGELDAALSCLCSLQVVRRRFSLGCGHGVVGEMEKALGMRSHGPQQQQLTAYLDVVRSSATESHPAEAMLRRALLRSWEETVFQDAQRIVDSEPPRQPFLRLGHAPDLRTRRSLSVRREVVVPDKSDSAVTALDFHADGSWLLVGLETGQVFLLDVDGQLLCETHFYCPVHLARFVVSADDVLIVVATSSEACTLRVKTLRRKPRLERFGKELLDVLIKKTADIKQDITAAGLVGRSLWILLNMSMALSFDVDVEAGGFKKTSFFSFLEPWERLLVGPDGRRAVVWGAVDSNPHLLLPDKSKRSLQAAGRVLAWEGDWLLLLSAGPLVTAVNPDTTASCPISSAALTEPLAAGGWKGRFVIVAGDWCHIFKPDGGRESSQPLARRRPGASCVVHVVSDWLSVSEESGVIQMYDLSRDEASWWKNKSRHVTPMDAVSGQPLVKEPSSGCTGRRAVAASWSPRLGDIVVAVVEGCGVRVQLARTRQVLLDLPDVVSSAAGTVYAVMAGERLAVAAVGDTAVLEVGLDGRLSRWSPGGRVLGLAVSARPEVVVAAVEADLGCRVVWRDLSPEVTLAGDGRHWRLRRFLPVVGEEGRAVVADAHMSADWRRLTLTTFSQDAWRTKDVKLHSSAAQPYALSHDARRLAVVDWRGRVQVWDVWQASVLHTLHPSDRVGTERVIFTASALLYMQPDAFYYVFPFRGDEKPRQGRFQFCVGDVAWLEGERLLLTAEGGASFHLADLASFPVSTVFCTDWTAAPRCLSLLAVNPACDAVLMHDAEHQLLLLLSGRDPVGEGRSGRRWACAVS